MPTQKYAKLLNTRILLLGGTAGIGYAVAEASIESGATVVISGSNAARLSTALSSLKESYPEAAAADKIHGHVCDLSQADALETNLRTTLEYATDGNKTKIDHVVFTAGDAPAISKLADYESSDKKWSAMIVRYEGGLVVAKVAPEYMNPGPKSSITFSGATSSRKPVPGLGILSGLGASLEGLAKGMAVDLAPIRVNLVALGTVDTGLLRRLAGPEVGTLLKSAKEGTLLDKIGAVEEVAEAYVYFMKDAFVTGQVLDTDGGRR